MSWIKRLLLVFLTAIVIMAAGTAFLLFGIDPNALKPQLQKQAAKQGVYLQLKGNITWKFFPYLGLNVQQAALFDSPEHDNEPILSFGHVGLAVALKPLLSRKLDIKAVQIDQLTLNYIVLKSGDNNLSALSKEAKPSAQVKPAIPSKTPDSATLSIDQIDIRNAKLNYIDKVNLTDANVSISRASLTNVNIENKPIAFNIEGQIEVSEYPIVKYETLGNIHVHSANKQFSISESTLSLYANNDNALVASIESKFSEEILSGDIRLTTNNIRPWVNLLNPSASINIPNAQLKNFDLASQFEISPTTNSIEANTTIKIDQSTLKGTTSIQLGGTLPAIKANWHGDKIIIDNYITKVVKQTETTQNDPTPTTLPIDLLRALDTNIAVKLNSLIFNDIDTKDIDIVFKAKHGILALEKFNAKIENSPASIQSTLNAALATPTFSASGNVDGLDIGIFAKKLGDFEKIQGNVNGTFTAKSTGINTEALSNNLYGTFDAQSEQLQFSPFNLIKSYCKAVAIVERKELPTHNWPNHTLISPLNIKAIYDSGVIKLDNLSGTIEQFSTLATGEYKLETGKFIFPISLSLDKFASDIEGCGSISEKWRKQKIPLVCKGSIDEIGINTCSLDMNYLTDRAEQRLKEKKNKEIDKLENDLENKAKDLLKKHLNDNEIEKLKQLFK